LALVAGFVLFALLDPPLGVIFLVAGALFEVAEATFWYRYLKRIRVRTGVEAMEGRPAEVIEPCRPRGRVKLDGEIWNAECAAGAEVGETVEVVAVEGLTLVVRPAAGGSEGQRR
jgi:membrane-bound serine protease (ClpP class)